MVETANLSLYKAGENVAVGEWQSLTAKIDRVPLSFTFLIFDWNLQAINAK